MTLITDAFLKDILPDAGRTDWPGCAIAIMQNGDVAQTFCTGLASVEHRVPIGPDTVFRIASVTKQMLCAGLVALADDGKLDLDAPLGDYIDLSPAIRDVTLRQAMSNTSGIRDHLELWYMAGGGLQVPHRLADSLRLAARQGATNFPPGSRYLYSNANFLLLSQVAETVSGQPVADYLEARFFRPLGMTRTRLRGGHHDVIEGMATGYVVDQAGDLKRGRITTELSGEGSACSCLNDLVKWVGYYRADPDGIIARLRVPQPVGHGLAPYGLGLFAETWRGISAVLHGGLWPGYLTEVLFVPEKDLAVITLANVNSIEPSQINRKIVEALIAEPGGPAPEATPDAAAWRACIEAGLWIEPDTLDVAEFTQGENGRRGLNTYGFAAALVCDSPETLRPEFARSDYAAIRIGDAEDGRIGLQLVNQETLTLVPAATMQPARDHADFVGTWWCDDIDALLRIRREGAAFEVETPGFRGHDWVATPLDGGILQIEEFTGPWPRRFFLLLQERGDHQVLIVNGPRVRRLEYRRREMS